MGQERLPVNIFQGALPGSYIFIDTGDSPEKWGSTAGIAPPFDSLDTSNSYGYFGDGMRASLNGGAVRKVCSNFRSAVGGPSNMVIGGFIVRPGGECYALEHYHSLGTPGRYFGCRFHIPDPNNINNNKWFQICITHKHKYTNKIIYNKATLLAFSPGHPGGESLDLGWERPGAAAYKEGGISYSGDLPWIRVTFFYQDGVIKNVTINGTTISVNRNAINDIEPFFSHVVIVGGKEDEAAANLYWDIDQIWISDTENRI